MALWIEIVSCIYNLWLRNLHVRNKFSNLQSDSNHHKQCLPEGHPHQMYRLILISDAAKKNRRIKEKECTTLKCRQHYYLGKGKYNRPEVESQ